MKKYLCVFLLLLLGVLLLPLCVRPMASPDETRYAEIAREILESGDWIVPHLNGVRYFEKPMLGNQIIALSMKCFGLNAFALRLPSVLAALISAFFLYYLMRKFRFRQRESFLASAIFLTMPMVSFLAVVGILDGMFALFITLCIGVFFIGMEQTERTSTKLFLYFLAGVFAGAAFLVKGFVGLAVPAITMFFYLCWEKRWKELFVLPWLPLLGAAITVAPWAYWIHKAEPDYWHYFVVVEHLNRFFGGEKAQHSESFFMLFPFLLVGMSIWLPFVPAAVYGLGKEALRNKFWRFCICWFLPQFLLFSASSGKLPSYILPCFPPLALLFAGGIASWSRTQRWRKLPDWTAYVLTAALSIGIVLLIVNFFTGCPFQNVFRAANGKLFRPYEAWKWLLVLASGGMIIAFLLSLISEKNLWRKLRWYSFVMIPVILCLQCVMPEYFIERKAPSEMMRKLWNQNSVSVTPPPAIVSYRYPFQDVCWVFRRNDVYMLTPGEIDYGLKYPDAKHRLLKPAQFVALTEEKKEKGGVLLIMPQNRYEQEKKDFPLQFKEIYRGEDDDCYIVIGYGCENVPQASFTR